MWGGMESRQHKAYYAFLICVKKLGVWLPKDMRRMLYEYMTFVLELVPIDRRTSRLRCFTLDIDIPSNSLCIRRKYHKWDMDYNCVLVVSNENVIRKIKNIEARMYAGLREMDWMTGYPKKFNSILTKNDNDIVLGLGAASKHYDMFLDGDYIQSDLVMRVSGYGIPRHHHGGMLMLYHIFYKNGGLFAR